MQRGQKRSFVVAVRAPAAADVDEHDLAAKLRVVVRHDFPVEVGEAEAERLRRILHARVDSRVGRLADVPGPCGPVADRDELGLGVLPQRQRTVGERRDFEEQRPRAGEVAEHESAIAIAAAQRSRVTVDAENRRRDLGARSARTMKRHAVSPLLLFAPTIHVPSIEGASAGAAGVSDARRALNG